MPVSLFVHTSACVNFLPAPSVLGTSLNVQNAFCPVPRIWRSSAHLRCSGAQFIVTFVLVVSCARTVRAGCDEWAGGSTATPPSARTSVAPGRQRALAAATALSLTAMLPCARGRKPSRLNQLGLIFPPPCEVKVNRFHRGLIARSEVKPRCQTPIKLRKNPRKSGLRADLPSFLGVLQSTEYSIIPQFDSMTSKRYYFMTVCYSR